MRIRKHRSNSYAAFLVALVAWLCAQQERRFLYVRFSSSFAFQPPVRISQRRPRVHYGVTGHGQVKPVESTGDTVAKPSHHKVARSGERCADDEGGDNQLIPPNPRRDEDRRLVFGTNASIADPYGWMRDDSRMNAEVRAHIEEENAYTRRVTRNLRDLEETLEIEYQQTMSSLSSRGDISDVFYGGDYLYYTKRLSTQSYAIHCRKLCDGNDAFIIENSDVPEEIVLDENELATTTSTTPDNAYLAIHTVLPSPSHQKIAFSVDTKGNELYEILIRDLVNGNTTTIATNTSGNFVWGNTDRSIHFTAYDSVELLRPCQWMTWSAYDEDIFTNQSTVRRRRKETDDRCSCRIDKSSDGKFILWFCTLGNLHKVWAMDIRNDTIFVIFAPFSSPNTPSDGCWHDVDHGTNGWLMISSYHNKRSSLFLLRDNADDWEEISCLDIQDDQEKNRNQTLTFEAVHPLSNSVILCGRNEGMPKIWVLDPSCIDNHRQDDCVVKTRALEFDEAAHYVSLGRHHDFFSERVVLSYESMLQPPQFLSISLHNHSDRGILYRNIVPGYDSNLYACDRRKVVSRDGVTEIPISMVYLKESLEQRPAPLHLLGYGAYGHSLEASFSTVRLSLLNRGVVCVIAHVRGGGEGGTSWHLGGSYHNKPNSICDFVDVASFLVESGMTSTDQLGIEGRSAGGLLVAGALNENPALFKTALLVVPFLDVLGTMADPFLPFTTMEYSEWGFPNHVFDYERMCTWSPLQNIQNGSSYPSMLALGGLYDSRVSFWEPLKYVATVRHEAKQHPQNPPYCVSIDPDAGHASGGNQTAYWKRLSSMYAFFLDQVKANAKCKT